MVESEVEAFRLFLHNYLDFAKVRLKHFKRHTFGEPGEVAGY